MQNEMVDSDFLRFAYIWHSFAELEYCLPRHRCRMARGRQTSRFVGI